MGGYRQQRYDSVIGISSDSNRSHMPSVNTNFARRTSNYDQAGSVDSGISTASNDSKLSNDSGYSSTGLYDTLKDTPNTHQNYTAQRSLPTPTMHNPYDRQPTNSYGHMETPAKSENMWQMGNASAGHAHPHYMAPQTVQHQQWASTGTS
jgi:hypothetical protein